MQRALLRAFGCLLKSVCVSVYSMILVVQPTKNPQNHGLQYKYDEVTPLQKDSRTRKLHRLTRHTLGTSHTKRVQGEILE